MIDPRLDAGRVETERLLRAIRQWAPLVVAASLLSGVVAFGVSRLIPPEYEASAQLYLAPASTSTLALQDVVLGQSLARSYVKLATTEVVLRAAMDQVAWSRDLKAFRERTTVAQAPETSVIAVTFRSADPARAADAANAIAASFISQSRALQQSLQGSTSTELEQQIRSVQDDIVALDQQISALRIRQAASPSPGEAATARAELQTQALQLDLARQLKQQTLAQLIRTRDDMRLAQARAETTVSLWQTATPPEEPVSPRVLLNTALAVMVAGLLAMAVVGLVAFLDDRLTDLEEVPRRLGIAALGQVKLHEHPETIVGKLFLRDEPLSLEAEAVRAICTNVTFASVDDRARSILVTSAQPSEGKSVLSANLALGFAEVGIPTILIDCDLRRPSQHRLFRVSAAKGLTTLLTETYTNSQLQAFRVGPQLIVVPSGPLPPNPAELLGSHRMSALLEQLRSTAENCVVILDSSPILAVADPIGLATRVEGTILVIDSSRTHVGSARRALAALRSTRAPILGAVLNKLPETAASYYRYDGYRYGTRRSEVTKAVTARRT